MNMRKALNYSFLILGLLCTGLIGACSDACEDVQCVNGTCSDGECTCATGYSGPDCATALNSRFDGDFSLAQNCLVPGNATDTVTLAAKSSGPRDFTILGLWGAPQNLITALIDDNGTSFVVERQAIVTGYEVEAFVGTISSDGNTVNLTYSIYATGDTVASDQCTATMQKIQ
ncbi:MAG: hypothetical protein RLZZ519_1217 [Bacteroidota bacterium]